MKYLIFSVLSIWVFLFTISCNENPKEKPYDKEEVTQFFKEYRQAWREGDSIDILNKLSPEVILYQAGKKGKPIIGKTAVADFWFPPSDTSYPILEYEVEEPEIGISGDLAYYQGISRLRWCTMENEIYKDTVLSVSEFTTILKREADEWKIFRIMFNLKDSTYTR